MTKRYTSRALTIVYFSLIAIALVTIHWSVFHLTTDDLEQLYAKNRLLRIQSYAQHYLNKHPRGDLDKLTLFSISSQELSTDADTETRSLMQNIELYFDFSAIPSQFPQPETMAFDELIELRPTTTEVQAYYVVKTRLQLTEGPVNVYFVIDNNLFEFSEEQLLSVHSKQILITLILLFISLIVIITIASKLTAPITRLANMLAQRSPNDLSPITIDNVATSELATLINTFNTYQQRIQTMVTRERSFNRYASHELRSPLMVMTGAVNIMEANDSPEVRTKQLQRLKKTTTEMSEFVETLLSLTKTEDSRHAQQRRLDEQEILNIVSTHEHLLFGKSVTWHLDMQSSPSITIPEFAFHILLGNIIKNAFAYTHNGEVHITVNDTMIQVKDTGNGLRCDKSNDAVEGYGLGLLLVRDICHRYHWTFSLEDNQDNGCTVDIQFN